MLSEFIDKIVQTAVPQKLIVDGREYFSRQLHPVLDPMPDSLFISTLTGLVDFVNDFGKSNILIHVHSHTQVSVVGQLQPMFLQRPSFITAIYDPPKFPFNQWFGIEEFIIALQSMFVLEDNIREVLSIIGNIKDGTVKTYDDDGISQAVTTKAGVATVKEIKVPNPVCLKPYRTFNEIQQPESQFIFRMRSAVEGGAPTCLLTEADGGKWKLDAILRIKEWLSKALPDIPIIA